MGPYKSALRLTLMMSAAGAEFLACAGARSATLDESREAVATVADSGSAIGEVIVTAQRREQKSRDIGASIAVVGANRLLDAGLTSAADVVELVSGVQAANAYGSQPVFQIRGVGASDFQVSTPPATGVYRDGVFLSANVQAGTQMFDLQRVEVLKGPQGTLYGRNSSAGAINYLTNTPTREFGGYLKADYGRFNRNEIEGAISGPLSPSLAYRLSGQLLRRDSPFDNVSVDPRFPAGSRDAGGVIDDGAVRGQLLYQPSERLSGRLTLSYSQQRGTSPNPKAIPDAQLPGSAFICPGRDAGSILGNIANPGCVTNANQGNLERSPHDTFSLGVGPDGIQPVDNRFYGASSEWQVALPVGTLTSLTAFEGFHNDFGMDYDGSVEPLLNLHYLRNMHQYSEELRLAGDAGRTHWIVGAYASYEDLNQDLLYFCGFLNPVTLTGTCNYFGAAARAPRSAPLPTSRANSVGSTWDRGTTTAALFSHNELTLGDRWSAIVGARYTYDRVGFSGRGFVVYDDSSQQLNDQGGLGAALGSSTLIVHKVTGTLGLNYKPSETSLAYVNVGEGFKSGGYEGSIFNNIRGLSASFQPETVRAIEVGFKSEPSHRLRFDLSAFYQQYFDPQARVDTILALPGGGTLPTTAMSNLHKAVVSGVEAETAWAATSSFTLGSSLTFYHSRVMQPFDAAHPTLHARFDGNKLAGAAPFSVVAYGKYDWRFGSARHLQLSANAKYLDAFYTKAENFGTSRQPAYALVSARAALISSSGLELSVWGKNLLDKAYTTVTFLGFGSDTYYPAEPRSWGLELRYTF